MRPAIYVAALAACIAVAPESTRAALASAAAVVFELLPYAAASAVLSPLFGRFARPLVAYAGCGCGAGPGARSIPAAVACAAVFGPHVALIRWVAAVLISAIRRCPAAHADDDAPLLGDLQTLAPSAVLAGVVTVAAPALTLAHCPPLLELAAGAMIGFAASPCALGGVALAAALRAQSPLASTAMLCVAGILDLRVWWNPHALRAERDRSTYALLAVACAIVAYEHGATLVHPRMTLPLWGCALFCVILSVAQRSRRIVTNETHDAILRLRCFAPALRMTGAALVLAAFLGSPRPPSTATEATLDTIYPGERIDFTGSYDVHGGRPHVVRYAITCCRADARPVGIELAKVPSMSISSGTWISVRGVVERRGEELVVAAGDIERVTPPADPFVYL